MVKLIDLDKTPFEVIDRRLTATRIAIEESASSLSNSRGEVVTGRDIENGLISVLGLDEIFGLLDRDIDSTQILSLLTDCNFSRLRPNVLCEIPFEESIMPEDFPLLLTEAKVKFKGEIWSIHKTDADPFPSNPHAHNYERQLKMDLRNGDLYSRKERRACGQIDRKNLVKLRDLVGQKNATILLPRLEI
jgi:hypothetical protein